MKRLDLIRYLQANACELLREGGSHSVFVNRHKGKVSAVPGHREINQNLARKICKDLEIPFED